jgi:hypothetical protein
MLVTALSSTFYPLLYNCHFPIQAWVLQAVLFPAGFPKMKQHAFFMSPMRFLKTGTFIVYTLCAEL